MNVIFNSTLVFRLGFSLKFTGKGFGHMGRIDLYNKLCNTLKQKVQNNKISMTELLNEIKKVTEFYFEYFGEFPPGELARNQNVNVAIPKFRKRRSGITTLQELSNLIIHLDEVIEHKYLEDQLVQLSENEYNRLVEEIKQLNARCTMEDIKQLLDGFITAGIVTENRAERILKHFKTCGFYRCGNVFYTGKGGKNKNSRFCSDRCRRLNHVALLRKERTGVEFTRSEILGRKERTEERAWQKNRVLMAFEQWMKHLDDTVQGDNQDKTLRKLREEQRIKELEELNKKQPVKTYYIKGE